MLKNYRFGLLGVGKMGSAILNGVLKKQLYKPSEIAIYTLEEEIKAKYQKLGINIASDEEDLFINCDIIVMAIKPQIYENVLLKLNGLDFGKQVIISIAPGKTIAYLGRFFPNAEIIRAMPNTPALIGKATITLSYHNHTKEIMDALPIFNAIGDYYVVEEEQIDDAIPLNGSMPAYVLKFAQSFIDCGIKYGIDENICKELALKAIIGSCELALESKDDISTLIQNVCSKGGTTIKGLDELNRGAFDDAITNCYFECVKRSKELRENNANF